MNNRKFGHLLEADVLLGVSAILYALQMLAATAVWNTTQLGTEFENIVFTYWFMPSIFVGLAIITVGVCCILYLSWRLLFGHLHKGYFLKVIDSLQRISR